MKVYSTYHGDLPTGVQIIREGTITRIYFDFAVEQRQDEEGNESQMLTAMNVDLVGNISYPALVNAIIRDKYSQSAVEAILANGEDTAEHASELNEFKAWRAKAKVVANEVISKL